MNGCVCGQLANLLRFLSSLPSWLMSFFGSIQPSKQVLLSVDTAKYTLGEKGHVKWSSCCGANIKTDNTYITEGEWED